MASMNLDHVEAGAFGIACRLRVVVAYAIHLAARDLTGHVHEVVKRKRRRSDKLPIAVRQRLIHAFPAAAGRTLATRVPKLEAELGAALLMYEITDPLPS